MPDSTTSDYLHDLQMDFLLSGEPYSSPANIYVALFTVKPTLAGTGGTEVVGGVNYVRKPIAQGGWTGPSGNNRQYSNTANIEWDVPSGNWGTIVALGLYDAVSSGNLLFVNSFVTPKAVSDGDGAPKILAGQLRISRATCS